MAQSAQIAKVNPWHQRLAEWLITNGTSKGWNKAAAEHFNVSQSWLSTVIHSDAFQDYFQRLSGAHSEALLLGVRERAIATADAAIGELQRRIEAAPESIPFRDLLDTSDTLLKRTGHGEGGSRQAAGVVNNFLVTKEDLASARDAMRQRSKPQLDLAVDAEVVVPPSDELKR